MNNQVIKPQTLENLHGTFKETHRKFSRGFLTSPGAIQGMKSRPWVPHVAICFEFLRHSLHVYRGKALVSFLRLPFLAPVSSAIAGQGATRDVPKPGTRDFCVHEAKTGD